MKCPGEVYQRSARAYGGAPQDIAYPGKYSRRVDQHGKVDWQGAEIAISGSLRGWPVGLNPLASGKVEVWFGGLLLGWIDRPAESFQGAASRP